MYTIFIPYILSIILCKSLSSYHTSHPSYSICVCMYSHRIVCDGWWKHIVELIIIIITIIFIILNASFLHFLFYFHVSSLHYYCRMDGQLSYGPVGMVTKNVYVLFWSTVRMWKWRLRLGIKQMMVMSMKIVLTMMMLIAITDENRDNCREWWWKIYVLVMKINNYINNEWKL